MSSISLIEETSHPGIYYHISNESLVSIVFLLENDLINKISIYKTKKKKKRGWELFQGNLLES